MNLISIKQHERYIKYRKKQKIQKQQVLAWQDYLLKLQKDKGRENGDTWADYAKGMDYGGMTTSTTHIYRPTGQAPTGKVFVNQMKAYASNNSQSNAKKNIWKMMTGFITNSDSSS